jgi:hypothetical protein
MFSSRFNLFQVDLMDESAIRKVFDEAKKQGMPFDAVIHFAGLKAVGESVQQPLRYYENNITGTIRLIKVMDEFDVRKIGTSVYCRIAQNYFSGLKSIDFIAFCVPSLFLLGYCLWQFRTAVHRGFSGWSGDFKSIRMDQVYA